MPLSEDEIKRVYLSASQQLHQFFFRRIRCPDTASDLVQDIYFRLRKINPVPCSDQEVKNWLFSVAANLSIDHIRGERRRSGLLESYGIYRDDVDGQADPEIEAQASDQLKLLQHALSQLSDRQAEILVMSRLEGLTHGEIAERLKISKSLVEKEVIKAITFCRMIMKENVADSGDR